MPLNELQFVRFYEESRPDDVFLENWLGDLENSIRRIMKGPLITRFQLIQLCLSGVDNGQA